MRLVVSGSQTCCSNIKVLVKVKVKVKIEVKLGVKVPLLQLQLWPRLRPSVVCLGGCWWPRGFMSLCELNLYVFKIL